MQHQHSGETIEAPVIDPVCGMTVDNPSDELSYEVDGHSYYFCSAHCLQKFKSEPGQFIKKSTGAEHPRVHKTHAQEPGVYTCPMHPEVEQQGPGTCPKCGMALEPRMPRASAGKVQWTCPMHPEVIRDEPGSCPKCGMALEPRGAELPEEEENREYLYMRNRFWVGVVLSLPLLLIAMRDMLGLGVLERLFGPETLHWTEFFLATPVVLWGGGPFTCAPGNRWSPGT
mgnify:CR=1 FL=1